jgi:hypothetical protein
VSRITTPPQQVTPQLCVLLQSSTSSEVQPGSQATFVIWVWSLKAASRHVSVALSVAAAPAIGSPKFTACPAATGARCTISNLPVGQADELVARVPVQSAAVVGEFVELSGVASAAGSFTYASTAVDVVVLTSAGPSSSTVTLPLPTILPPIAGTGVNAINPATLFPTVGSTGTGSIDPPAAGTSVLRATTDASAVPLSRQLIGAEVAGLVAILGAVIVAVVRVALRTPKPAMPVKTSASPEQPEQKS